MPVSRPSNIASATPFDAAHWSQVIEKMTELTNKRTLKWDVADAADARVSSPQKVLAAYDTRFDEKIVRLLEMEPVPSSVTSMATILGTRRVDYSLALIDRNGSPLFAFPRDLELIELLAAIKRQVADVDSFVEALFAAA